MLGLTVNESIKLITKKRIYSLQYTSSLPQSLRQISVPNLFYQKLKTTITQNQWLHVQTLTPTST